MTAVSIIIDDALRDINVISEVENASAEQGSYALRKLNQMMEAGKEMDIELGYFALGATTDTIPIPDWAEIGVTALLSMVLAPKYGATISMELAGVGSAFKNMIQRKVQSEKNGNTDLSHLPIGSGHYYGDRRSILTDS